MRKEWIELEGFGSLAVEQVLVSFDVPILFVCENQNGKRFLTLCIDDEEGRYVIAEVLTSNLIGMLNNDITMEYVFRQAVNHILYVTEYDFDKEKFNIESEDSLSVSKEILPKEGMYFELNNEKIRQYCRDLRGDKVLYKKEESQYYEIALQNYKQPSFVITQDDEYDMLKRGKLTNDILTKNVNKIQRLSRIQLVA